MPEGCPVLETVPVLEWLADPVSEPLDETLGRTDGLRLPRGDAELVALAVCVGGGSGDGTDP